MNSGPATPTSTSSPTLRLVRVHAKDLSTTQESISARAERTADSVELTSQRPARSLIGATVSGSVNFDAAIPMRENTNPIQLYHHPADLNAAATRIEAGRLDITA